MISEVITNVDGLLKVPQIEQNQTVFYFRFEEKNYSLGLPQGADPDSKSEAQRGIFYEIFGRYTASKEKVRKWIFVFLCISLCLFLLALLQHVIKGAEYVLQWMCSCGGAIEFLLICKDVFNGVFN